MGKYDKKYDAFQLFEQILEQEEANPSYPPEGIIPSEQPENTSGNKALSEEGIYYEIEYDSVPMPGVGKFVQKSQKIESPVRDEIREKFEQMRDIARECRDYRFPSYRNSRFYDQKVLRETSKIFYKQGMFLKDFEDDYSSQVPFSSYFPYYQMMGYQQLRTYFTWRTQVRKGVVTETSLSYAYLYIYELLNNIGVENPQDGVERLIFFWKEFRTFHNSIDKYLGNWLKDYYIYYELAQPFPEFIKQNDLTGYYQESPNPKDSFSLLCTASKYDIRKSVFFTEDREQLIRDCITYTLDRVRHSFSENHLDFDDFLYYPAKNMAPWEPFRGALFYPWFLQRDRRVVFSEKEIYLCSQNKWTYQTSLTNESGRKLLGYILKQTESVLRQAVNYKYKITASIHTLPSLTLTRLIAAGIPLEEVITQAVMDFYRESTRTVVKVDAAALEKIRQEALATQEKLIVPEEKTVILPQQFTFCEEQISEPQTTAPLQKPASSLSDFENDTGDDPWAALRNALSDTERAALAYLLSGKTDIKGFADEHGIMLEVLMDEINEKAMDAVGDSLVDEEFTIYEDYIAQVKEMVE